MRRAFFSIPAPSGALWLTAMIALALSFSSCSKNSAEEKPKATGPAAIVVTVVPVEIVKADRTIPIVGTLYPKDEATLGAEVEGHVEKTMVEFGDRVKAGQEIASIDTSAYEARAHLEAANVTKAKAKAADAERELKRMQELRNAGIASPSDLDKAQSEAEQARAEVKAAQATEAIATMHLDHSHVRAPFDAAIADRVATTGDFMKVGEPLFRIVNDTVLKYITAVPERHAADVKRDQLVTFTVDAWPGETFSGKVLLISPSVNLKTRNFSFGALVDNHDLRLKANTFARGELILERDAPTLMVPLDALVSFAGITKVFVVENGAAKAREVTVGKIREGRQEILAGLKAGETVVVSGQTKLLDGSKVALRSDATTPATAAK
ncbi:MAG: efflux RND transporter periplasmic adaptor subunit [Verrucomicrobia bacterium]|nr:efflux RND transporter periplasmic adaptor subunit [Verrucomicrobiota bacterium]